MTLLEYGECGSQRCETFFTSLTYLFLKILDSKVIYTQRGFQRYIIWAIWTSISRVLVGKTWRLVLAAEQKIETRALERRFGRLSAEPTGNWCLTERLGVCLSAWAPVERLSAQIERLSAYFRLEVLIFFPFFISFDFWLKNSIFEALICLWKFIKCHFKLLLKILRNRSRGKSRRFCPYRRFS